MFRLACALLLVSSQFVGHAADAPAILPHDESNYVDARPRRTLFNIVWGCVSTTGICAWVAVHPNIPPRESPFKTMLRKLELMIWTILAPGILPCWAVNQLLGAMTVRDVYNKEKGYEKERRGIWKTVKGWFSLREIDEAASKAWTLRHGHFLIMGGIQLIEPAEDGSLEKTEVVDQGDSSETTKPRSKDMENGRTQAGNALKPRVTILTLEMLEELVKDPEFDIEATEEDIAHRSKGDGLTKIIFVFQSTWFILNCLGRICQGLYLTPLELTTLGLASLNGITLALWWHKPLDAQAVVRVHLKRKLTDVERNAGRNQFNRWRLIPFTQQVCENRITAIHDLILCRSEGNIFVAFLIRLPFNILLLLFSPIITFLLHFTATPGERTVEEPPQSLRSRFLPEIQKFYNSRMTEIRDFSVCPRDLARLPFSILLLLFMPLIAFALACFAGWSDLITTLESFPAEDTHVPTFYAPKHRYPLGLNALTMVTLGTTLGAIHCAGWNLPFPTYKEQKIWRIASLALTIMPISLSHLAYTLMRVIKLLIRSHPDYDETLLRLTLVIFTLITVSARFILLGLAVTSLRHLPPTAFVDVDWTKFYPHLLGSL